MVYSEVWNVEILYGPWNSLCEGTRASSHADRKAYINIRNLMILTRKSISCQFHLEPHHLVICPDELFGSAVALLKIDPKARQIIEHLCISNHSKTVYSLP